MVQSLTTPSVLSMEYTASVAPDPADILAMAVNPLSEIPLTALSRTTRQQLSHLLNLKKLLRSEEGYERDWRGIAALSQQKSLCDESTISGDDPMAKVLQLWCTNNAKTATFENLERFLGIIDRWDVCDDIYENLVEDAKTYADTLQQKSSALLQQQTDNINCTAANNDFGLGSDANILTKDDVLNAQKGLPPQKYDAFVLFANADINYAVEMLTKLEDDPVYHFKLCLKDRDLLAGVSFAHEALTQLIEERCKHLIVILTEEFLKSPENQFLVNYAQALQIQHKTRKIIPLLYEDTVLIPRTLKIYTHLKYNAKVSSLYNFWTKLADSIRNANISTVQPAAVYGKENSTVSVKQRQQSPAHLHAPPTEIPSISVNGLAPPDEVDCDDVPKKKERTRFKKRSSLRHTSGNKLLLAEGTVLRNAHSTSQLNAASVFYDTNLSLMTDLSASTCSGDTKKKKKWPSKLFKKVFSRSSSRLQEA